MNDIVQDGRLVPGPADAQPPYQEPIVKDYPRPLEPKAQPDTPIAVTTDTTVVVQTNSHNVRDYAVMFRMRLYNGTHKVKGWVAFLKGRLGEKTTYVFLGAGIAAASALPSPWSYLSMAVSVIAAMVPDHVINDDGSKT